MEMEDNPDKEEGAGRVGGKRGVHVVRSAEGREGEVGADGISRNCKSLLKMDGLISLKLSV